MTSVEIDVEDKARKIGEDMDATDAVSSEPSEADDYEIVDNTSLQSDEDAQPDDDRIAKERGDRPKLSNHEKKLLRKKRTARKFAEKDALIQEQQRQIAELAAWRAQVDGRLVNADRAQVEQAIRDQNAQLNHAKQLHAQAFQEGDSEKAMTAMMTMYDAQRNIEKLQNVKIQAPQQSVPSVDSSTVSKAQAWAKRNPWYDVNGSDEDSELARSISGVLVKQGKNPRSSEFWNELDQKLQERNIGKQVNDDDDENDNDDDENDVYEEPVKPKKRQSSPPVTMSGKRTDVSAKQKISLPLEYINYCKEKGWWDTQEKRDEMIARYRASRDQ